MANSRNIKALAFLQPLFLCSPGHRLQSEELRQGNRSVLVQHYNIQSLELRSKAAPAADKVVRLAHHLLLSALTPSKLGEMCPNTRALDKTLRYLMMKVHEASTLVVDMDRIEHSHCYFRFNSWRSQFGGLFFFCLKKGATEKIPVCKIGKDVGAAPAGLVTGSLLAN